MTRHELKEGKWYLIKNNRNDYSVDMKLDGFEFNERHGVCQDTEWVEIDPELVFKLFKDGAISSYEQYMEFSRVQ